MQLLFWVLLAGLWSGIVIILAAVLYMLLTLYELYYMPLPDSPFMLYPLRAEAWRLLGLFLGFLAALLGLQWLLRRRQGRGGSASFQV